MKRTLSIALAGAVFLVGACGDDDDTETGSASAPTETTAAGDEGEQAAGDGDFCTTFQELLSGEPTPDQVRALGEIAPEGVKASIDTIATMMEEQPDDYFQDPAFAEAFGELGSAGVEECADETVDVTAIDYAFEGIPAEVPSGTIGINLTNDGEELHEMIIVRKNDGVTESFEEIVQMEEGAAMELVTEAGFGFANPGETSGGLYDLSEPGEYAAICFIPVGTTGPDTEGDGPPHFTQGMLTTFTVG